MRFEMNKKYGISMCVLFRIFSNKNNKKRRKYWLNCVLRLKCYYQVNLFLKINGQFKITQKCWNQAPGFFKKRAKTKIQPSAY